MLLSFAEFARWKGISKDTVAKAFTDGKFSTRKLDGQNYIDPWAVEKEWDTNENEARRESTRGKLTKAQREVELARALGSTYLPESNPSQPSDEPAPVPIPPPLLSAEIAQIPEVDARPVGEDDEDRPYTVPTFTQSRALKEVFLARIAKLEFDKRSGTLIDYGKVEKKWIAVAAVVRTKVLSIPSRAKQRLFGLTYDQYIVLEELCREVLDEISDESPK